VSSEYLSQLPDVPSLTDAGSQPFGGGTTAAFFAHIETSVSIHNTLNGAGVAPVEDEQIAHQLVELSAVMRLSPRRARRLHERSTG
jgi:tripartite-type tricarboxylate transporter receptor subunit TctC